MHFHDIQHYSHDHAFHADNSSGERRTLYVVLLTAVMMVVEIGAGYLYGSMALLADGWHMGTHVAALGISLFAYGYARRHSANPLFSFGTGKVTSLGGFASAVTLALVAVLMGAESMHRLLEPENIGFNQAILVAVIGLVVNLASAWLLHHEEPHHHDHGEHHHHHHHDHNLRAAYLHVIADALTSVLAIVALLCGKAFGWIWMDALMGIVGAVIITKWSIGLLKETGNVLLDGIPNEETAAELRRLIEADADNRIADLHLWQVGPSRYAAIISLVTHQPRDPSHYKQLVAKVDKLAHLTVEVLQCSGGDCEDPSAKA